METKTREEIPVRYTWDLTFIFENDEAWESAFSNVDSLLEPILNLKGKLNESASNIEAVLRLDSDLERKLDSLSVYAHLKNDQDLRESKYQEMYGRARTKRVHIAAETAWIHPEILSIPTDDIDAFMQDDVLAPWRRALEVILRVKPHMLSGSEEKLLASAMDPMGAFFQTYLLLCNADMTLGNVTNAEGKLVPLTRGNFARFLESPSRAVRRGAFEQMYTQHAGHKNTFASLLNGAVKKHAFVAKARRHESSLEAALFANAIPPAVYTSLIDAVRTGLPVLHRYFRLRQRALGLDSIDMYDMYVPLAPHAESVVEYDDAVEWVLKALAPLGSEYVAQAARALKEERWADVFETPGKRSGAYSAGGCYDARPYMLLNWQRNIDSVFTLAHELGHSMHTHLANTHQPAPYADYATFVAEVASTVNEGLLHQFLLRRARKANDEAMVRYLLNHRCDAFKSTLFRQTQFAEFEKAMHEKVDAGESLSADSLSTLYRGINDAYYGEENRTTGVHASAEIQYEWTRIPHFYMNFYVYQYATSFAAAEVFVKRITRAEDGVVDRYLGLLQSGSILDPLALLQRAGVDLSQPRVIVDAITAFEEAVHSLAEALKLSAE